MSDLTSPVVFKAIDNIIPFVGKKPTGVISESLGDVSLCNLLTVDVNVKDAAKLALLGGVKLRIGGRNLDTEPTNAYIADGVCDGFVFNEKTPIVKAGKYKIHYDISAVAAAWVFTWADIPNSDLLISEVLDIRCSLQNSNNILSIEKSIQNEFNLLNKKGKIVETFEVSTFKALDFNLQMFGDGVTQGADTPYYELTINGNSALGVRKGLRLFNKDGSEYRDPRALGVTGGVFYVVWANTLADLILDVDGLDSIEVSLVPKRTAATDLPFNLIVRKNDAAFSSINPIVWQGIGFNLEKTKKIADCHWNTFVVNNGASIAISVNGIDGNYTEIPFDAVNFPNLKTDSTIESIYVLPYSATSKSLRGQFARVVVMTSKGQCYHNNPNRVPVGYKNGDEFKFDESVIWDLPIGKTTRRHPTNSSTDIKEGYRHDPSLSAYSYQFVPEVNKDNGYGNGGFGYTVGKGDLLRPRFYAYAEPSATVDSPYKHLGYITKSRKLSTIGVYQIQGQRVCLFGTPDGGRNWYVLFEFSSDISFGNPIDTTSLGAYTANSLTIRKRNYIFPTTEIKEPENLFFYSEPIVVSDISNASPAVVTTTTEHGLKNKDIVLFGTNGVAGNFSFMANNDANEKVSGNGVMYMVEVVNKTSFKLHEFIYNPDTNLTCRHIHYTNLLKDFIAFGTGEEYPNGWCMLMDNRQKDAYMSASPELYWFDSYRLNSSNKGMQRLCSFWMNDDNTENPTIFCGMDSVNIPRNAMTIEGRTNLPNRSSAGILKGKLSDIDDISKFQSVLDVEDVNIYVKDMNGVLVTGFQNGYSAISLDKGETWEVINMEDMLSLAGVDRNNIIYFNNGTRLKLK